MMTLEEYEARAKAVLRVRRNGPGDDEITAADVLARDVLALVARVREAAARGPVMPETPSDDVRLAFEDAIFEWGCSPNGDGDDVWNALRNALMNEPPSLQKARDALLNRNDDAK